MSPTMNTTFRVLEDTLGDETESPSNYTNAPTATYVSSTSYFLWNFARDSDSTSLQQPVDVPVAALITSIYFNTAAFIVLMIFYEFLRRTIPSVYSSRKRLNRMRPVYNRKDTNPLMSPNQDDNDDNEDFEQNKQENGNRIRKSIDPSSLNRSLFSESSDNYASCTSFQFDQDYHKLESKGSLPDSRPLDWIQPVLGVPWSKVLQSAGLDGYFFLRYIRMCVRITAVSSFWFFLILVPIYGTSPGNNSGVAVTGLYYLSIEHIPKHGWRMWIACLFAYLFSFFIFFVIKQEYRHFLEVRQDFLAKGSIHVNPQHHYSILVESIPYELRSDRALAEYFDTLFPGKVHSASVVLKLPDLERTSNRCLRSCRRLEKSLALLHANGKRPLHFVGRGRILLLGIELLPFDCPVGTCKICGTDDDDTDDDDSEAGEAVAALAGSGLKMEKPKKGTRVDSISYYTQELALNSRALFRMQQSKAVIAESGNEDFSCNSWFDSAVREATIMANQILDESATDNALVTSTDSDASPGIAERMTSRYGSISQATLYDRSSSSHSLNGSRHGSPAEREPPKIDSKIPSSEFSLSIDLTKTSTTSADDLQYSAMEDDTAKFKTPFATDQYRNVIFRIFGRLGLDFLISITQFVHSQLDFAYESVLSNTMSSTGMLTFLDLSSVACAASAPLTVKASVLDVSVAPEPREIIWENAHVSRKLQKYRETISNVVLFLGVLLWSFPLAFIQAVANMENIGQLPGMEWILEYNGGSFSRFVNGYLPVVALLGLIMILPVIFEYIAVKFEQRKTLSDVQASMLGRYFNYQLVNIYVTVTAGSLLWTITDIVDHPIEILSIGAALPRMAGYFLALLVTKILSGLPMVFLRFGALIKMIFLKLLSNEKKLTQREIDAVYRLENVQYGWEFPTQLLVVVIVFTYAIMCPIILPVGMIYFSGALTVYKKQILYVYSPVYESGGAMFPPAVQKTLFGLVCAQITFLGYIVSRQCHYQPMFLAPLPIITILVSNYFKNTYADPSEKLSLERARAFDNLAKNKKSDVETPGKNADKNVETKFDKMFYRQPVLTEVFREPWTYRRGLRDEETLGVRENLRRMNRFITQTQMKGLVASMKAINSCKSSFSK